MDYQLALTTIKKEYKLNKHNETYSQIETDILFDDYNYIFIGVLNSQNKTLLVDYAEYAQLVDYDAHKDEIVQLANKHHIKINDYHLVKEYCDNKDIKEFIDFLFDLKKIDS